VSAADEPRAVALHVNGRPCRGSAEPRLSLADFLRHELGFTGTHVGCEHGVCGACTVRMDGALVRSCLVLAVQAEGAAIETVEGIAGDDEELHPLQRAFRAEHGLQCGFCTPGFLLVALDLLERNPDPTDEEIREAIAGNICRCTGYASIVASIKRAAGEAAA
jgi:aerobic-type carbon monoxide dehydrogenase small subunit (CoxS/CutS family)